MVFKKIYNILLHLCTCYGNNSIKSSIKTLSQVILKDKAQENTALIIYIFLSGVIMPNESPSTNFLSVRQPLIKFKTSYINLLQIVLFHFLLNFFIKKWMQNEHD